MKPAAAIVTATWRQILGTKRLLLFGALAIFPGFIFFVASDGQSGRALLQSYTDGANVHFTLTVPITALILSTAALGTERRDQTLSFVVLRPIRRGTIAGAKLVAAFSAAVAVNAVGALLLSILLGVRGSEWRFVVPLLVGSAVATIVYTAVFVPLGYITERSTLIGLAYVFIWESAIVGGLGVLGVTSPWRIGYMAFAALWPANAPIDLDDFIVTNLSVSLGSSILQAAMFLTASVALVTWILRQRDLV